MILFCDIDYIKDLTGINQSVDSAKFRAVIYATQRLYIEPILGTDLYNAIESKISGSTLTGNYQTLVNTWVAPCIAYFTYIDLMDDVGIPLDRGGVYRNSSVNTTTANLEEMNRLAQVQRKRAEFFSERLVSYLCNNSTLFPEFTTNSDEDISPLNNPSPFDSLYLGNTGLTKYQRKTGYNR